ncbi:MAG: YdeI/OmpD-associated family protein [Bacteroidales bacterium]|nr:YdeI/OmpD-associated family protein [Bacteroidales bacterium]
MKTGLKSLQLTNREEWRSWLEDNHKKEKEIWLVYYKRHTCNPRIPYDDAVEEAICYGWIDSIIKRIDENTYCQKYTPRRRKSKWSQKNIERAEKMIALGRMTESGLESFKEAKRDPSLIIKTDDSHSFIEIPEDMKSELQNTRDAFRNFISFPKSYRKMCIGWINAAKKPETRNRRITEVAGKAAEGKKIGLK